MQFHEITFKLCSNGIHLQVASILKKHTGGLSGRALASLTKTSTFKMHHTLKFMTAQGVLTESIVGKAHVYRLNHNHVLTQKILLPLVAFQENLMAQLGNDMASCLKPKPLSILLYGSIARGEEEPTSDLDIFIIYNSKKKSGRIRENDLWMDVITRKYGNAVSIRRSYLSEFISRYKEKDALIQNIFKEGKVIYGLSFIDLLNYGR